MSAACSDASDRAPAKERSTAAQAVHVVAGERKAQFSRRLVLDGQVALRPEPFGALAYHYGNRKLIFLRHPDILRVVQALEHHDTVADALRACDIAEERWPTFATALDSLVRSEMLREFAPAH